jgi:hypothetical protein
MILWRSSRRRGAAHCPRRTARGNRGAGHRGAAAASNKLWRISLLERPKLRRRPLQQALPRTAAVAESRLLRHPLELILNLFGAAGLEDVRPVRFWWDKIRQAAGPGVVVYRPTESLPSGKTKNPPLQVR